MEIDTASDTPTAAVSMHCVDWHVRLHSHKSPQIYESGQLVLPLPSLGNWSIERVKNDPMNDRGSWSHVRASHSACD